jgi:hypothetical protein
VLNEAVVDVTSKGRAFARAFLLCNPAFHSWLYVQ